MSGEGTGGNSHKGAVHGGSEGIGRSKGANAFLDSGTIGGFHM